MTGLAAIDAGLSYHTRTLRTGRFASLFRELIDLRDLGETDLSPFPTLLIPCRTNGTRLAPHAAKLARYVDDGGFLVVLGETHPELFLDGVTVNPVPTNFWWWLEPGADLGVRVTMPDHPLMRRLPVADLTWHIHGTLTLAEGGTVIAAWDDPRRGGAIFLDCDRGLGRLMVTTLDPIYHHGSGFMPATSRFLDAFLPWLAEESAR